MTGIQMVVDSPYSPRIFNCNFSSCKLNNGHINYCRFSDCEFTDADFSGTDVDSSIFAFTNLQEVKCDDKTSAEEY